MGNFTRDTFDKLKHYVGVRMQQGVPILDADWNEMEDIRKYELRTFIKWYLGNGVPPGNTGFCIMMPQGNDFTIKGGTPGNPGRCLVEGWDVIIEEDINYTQQPLYNNDTLAQEWGVDPLEPYSPGSGNQTDTVYLDIWEREVDAQEDNDLVNPAIGIETCVRVKREWVVRVAAGTAAEELPAPPEGHVYYPLAMFIRTQTQTYVTFENPVTGETKTQPDQVMSSFGIQNLRRTGMGPLWLLTDAITAKDGNVGVGTTEPEVKLHITGGSDASPDQGGYLVLGPTSGSNIVIDDNEIMARKNNEASILHLQNEGGDLKVHGNVFVIKDAGNVGIGTADPSQKLSIYDGELVLQTDNNAEQQGILYQNAGGVYTWRIYRDDAGSNQAHLRIAGGADSDYTALIDRLVIDKDGNVGIGETSPGDKLEVKGGLRISSPTENADIQLNSKTRPTIYPAGPNVPDDLNIQIRSQGSGKLELNSDNSGDVWIAAGGGSVGIGTSTPYAKLDVKGDVMVTSPTTTGIYGLELKRTDEDNRIHSWKFWHMNNSYGKNSLQLFEYKTDSTGKNCGGNAADGAMCDCRITVKEGGNVGIGTSSPGEKLEVNGNIKIAADKEIIFADNGQIRSLDNSHRILFRRSENKMELREYGQIIFSSGATAGEETSVAIAKANGHFWAAHRTGDPIDYAEYFESKNGKEIKAGTSVVLDGGKIRPAKKGETPFGIISANPLIAGGVPIEWPGKYLRDEFGSQIMEEFKEEIMVPKKEKVKKERQKMEKKKIKEKVTRTEIAFEDGKYFQKEITETIEQEVEEPVFKEVDLYDAKKKNIIGKHRIPVMETYEEEIQVLDKNGEPVMTGTGKFETTTRPKLNPKYDGNKEYTPREDRPEWNCVGLLGQLPLRKGQPTAGSWIKIKNISKDVELWLVK